MKKKQSVLLATADVNTAQTLSDCLRQTYDIVFAADGEECLFQFKQKRHEYSFIDIHLLGDTSNPKTFQEFYKSALRPYLQHYPSAEIVIVAPVEMIRQAVSAVKAGASNYISEPVSPDEVKLVTERIREEIIVHEELDYLRDQFWEKDFRDVIKTRSPLMQEVFKKIRSVAPTRTTVLLQGETGTGKGVMARLIHAHSNRRDSQFISVHCGAIPETLIESELFGHEKGAFTGADRRKMGKFELAQDGTLFLDEISTIAPTTQVKLLQVLQDRMIQPVGAEVAVESDARFIAATNVDLKEMANAGSFRRDLYYRLNVFPIELPPLRERKEDIAELVSLFLNRLNLFHGKGILSVHPSVLAALTAYDWPGNIRELENLIERAYILESADQLAPKSFPGELFQEGHSLAKIPVNTSQKLVDIRRAGIENIERQYLKALLVTHKGRIDKSADAAGISTRQLSKLLKKYRIKKEAFKP